MPLLLYPHFNTKLNRISFDHQSLPKVIEELKFAYNCSIGREPNRKTRKKYEPETYDTNYFLLTLLFNIIYYELQSYYYMCLIWIVELIDNRTNKQNDMNSLSLTYYKLQSFYYHCLISLMKRKKTSIHRRIGPNPCTTPRLNFLRLHVTLVK